MHQFFLLPLYLTTNYTLPNPHAAVFAVIGGGISLMGKADHNKSLDKTHYALTYGYHAAGSLRIRLKARPILSFELMYNLLMPTVNEDLNISGVMLTAGIYLPVGKK